MIDLCWDTDRLIKRTERAFEADPTADDRQALLDQAEWLVEAMRAEEDPKRRAEYHQLADELLQLFEEEFWKRSQRRVAQNSVLSIVWRSLGVTASYALSVAFNSILLSALYLLLIAAALVALKSLLS